MTRETYSGPILSLAFGGAGIARSEGFVTFIPFTAIDDEVEYEIIKRKKHFAFGKILRILKPSPHRRQPACPYFGSCGGCQLQHLKLDEQLKCKRQWVEDALTRPQLTDLKIPPVISSNEEWHYRRKIVLTLQVEEDHYIAGYHAIDPAKLIQVTSCPIFALPADPILSHVQKIASELKPQDISQAKAALLKTDQGRYLLHLHFKKIPKNISAVIEKASQLEAWQGIIASSPKETLVWKDTSSSLTLDGLTFKYAADAFVQAHPEQSLQIYRNICSVAKELKPKQLPINILDLYCGIGISSLMLAKTLGEDSCKIIGVEGSQKATNLAKENGKINGINNVSFTCGLVEDVLKKILTKETDLVLLNPPREGVMPSVIEQLVKTRPATIIYISCMPITLARDIKPLIESGYKMTAVQPYDMFPQTTHIETMVILNR